MSKKSKKTKVVTLNGKKFDVIYREHDARSTTTRDLLNLFVIHTMDSYVLIPHKEFPVRNTITIQVADHIQCSVLGDVNCSKHKIQPLLNRINLEHLGEDVNKIDSIAINLHVNDANDPKKVIQTTTIWIKVLLRSLRISSCLSPKRTRKRRRIRNKISIPSSQ